MCVVFMALAGQGRTCDARAEVSRRSWSEPHHVRVTGGSHGWGNAGDGSDYGTQPGFDVAQSHTRCSGAGAFGYLGKDFNMKGGADGTATGNNNSGLCGNPQDD